LKKLIYELLDILMSNMEEYYNKTIKVILSNDSEYNYTTKTLCDLDGCIKKNKIYFLALTVIQKKLTVGYSLINDYNLKNIRYVYFSRFYKLTKILQTKWK
jgi:hypothetical protein